jgi:hypothetical protein
MTRPSYKTEYMIREWRSLADLTLLLNTFVNEGWRVDNHKLGNAGDYTGWTIFSKTTSYGPLLDRNIGVSEVYSILNRVLEPGSDKAREVDAAIKKAVRQDGDEF